MSSNVLFKYITCHSNTFRIKQTDVHTLIQYSISNVLLIAFQFCLNLIVDIVLKCTFFDVLFKTNTITLVYVNKLFMYIAVCLVF